MIIHVFSPEFERIGVITAYISLVWKEKYNGKGYCTLVVNDNEDNIKMLQVDNRLWQNGKLTSMIIKETTQESRTRQIIVNGEVAVTRLKNRVFANMIRFNNVESGIRSMITNNIGAGRNLSRFVLAPSEGFTESHQTEMTGYDLLEACSILTKEVELGFMSVFDHQNKRDVFTIYKGEDKSVNSNRTDIASFKDGFGNLPNMTIKDDKSFFKNFAYVAGSGENEERTIVTVGSATNDARYEHYVDARDIQPDTETNETVSSPSYLARLRARGTEHLNERIRVRNFVAEAREPRFGETVRLGDIVTVVSSRYGVMLNTRMMEYQEITENNSMRREFIFGNAEYTLLQVAKLQ
jgi:hypothetical protein